MKKLFLMFLCVFLMLSVCSCKSKDTQKESDNNAKSSVLDSESNASVSNGPKSDTTLLIYMIGSDLEAKGGAGTNDMEEIIDSGLDASETNVLIYTGGSRKWHNDNSSNEEHNILKLTEDGFETIESYEPSSMGEPECLTRFLEYGYNNAPAEEYALILWNHGNGPVIGYGKDMIYDNDSLTLKEMSTALADSPFGKDNKFAWVGFDACFMASAELACVWADYAEYLIASQEVEPSFGWNYDFLSELEGNSTEELMGIITDSYLETCLKYYERKGYDQRDTTLACFDLSYADELKSAINDLFDAAADDVSKKYNDLTSRRTETRAFGRASTGSEYDLIDLNDMAEQLSDIYPDEAEKIQDIISDMVIANANNTEESCGMSIYYPFYNKTYYEDEWNETYTELNIFPSYSEYLKEYAKIWLGNDFLNSYASSISPNVVSSSKYELELTDDQAEVYADSKFYVLKRVGDGLYTIVFTSGNTSKKGNKISADFDGEIIYAKNKFDQYMTPIFIQHDTIGNISRYSAYVNLVNETVTWTDRPEGWEHIVEGHRFQLAVDTKTKDISVSALVPYYEDVDTSSLSGGKLEDADLERFSMYYFLQDKYRYLTRYDNGAIMPIAEWPVSGSVFAYVSPIRDDVEFLFAPLTSGEYFLMFEIQDTQGNKFSSDLLTIEADGVLGSVYEEEEIVLNWESGDKLKLFEKENVTVYLTSISDEYGSHCAVYAENKNDFPVAITDSFNKNTLYVNGNIYCNSSAAFFTVPANGNATSSKIDFGTGEDYKVIEKITEMSFYMDVRHSYTCKTLVKNQPITIKLSEEKSFVPSGDWLTQSNSFKHPFRDILAEEQVIFSENGITATLLGLGGNDRGYALNGVVRIENTNDSSVSLQLGGLVFDGIYVENTTGYFEIPANSIMYQQIYISEDKLDVQNVLTAEKVTLQISFSEFATLDGGGGFATYEWYELILKQSGKKAEFIKGNKEIYNEDGIIISELRLESDSSSALWYYTVENNSDKDIYIDVKDIKIDDAKVPNGVYANFGASYSRVGAGQKTTFRISYYNNPKKIDKIEFRFLFMDFTNETALFEAKETITLYTKK